MAATGKRRLFGSGEFRPILSIQIERLILPELTDWTRKCRDPERPTLTPYMLWTDVRNITCAHLTHNHGELSV